MKNSRKYLIRLVGAFVLLFALSLWPEKRPRSPEQHSMAFWIVWPLGAYMVTYKLSLY